jgi:hypothetical protein
MRVDESCISRSRLTSSSYWLSWSMHFHQLCRAGSNFNELMRVFKLMRVFAIAVISSQLSCNSCSRLTWAWELRKIWCKLSLLNSHATLVLVWPGYESWENSQANSRFSTLMQLLFLFEQGLTFSLRAFAQNLFLFFMQLRHTHKPAI